MSQAAMSIDGKHFRNALGSFATGVTIVTTSDAEGRDVGLTANSFNSVSLDPPMVLWSLARSSASLPAFMENDHFAVHVLAADQQPLSDLFARRGAEKFGGAPVHRGAGGVPLLDGCSARFQCKTAFRHEGGDHVILVGEVLAFDHFEKAPLVFHGGKYAKMMPRLDANAANGKASAAVEVESSFRKDFLGYLLGFAAVQLHRPVRARCQELGLSDAGYYVLSVLMARPEAQREQIDELLARSAGGLTREVEQELLAHGYVTIDEDKHLRLTPGGRQVAIELFAIAKSAESSAESAIDFEEAGLLKQLLRRVIRSTLDEPSNDACTQR